MDYKTIKPFDSRSDEEKDWQQRLREMSLKMGNGAGKPGEIRRPGFARQPGYSLMTASNETQQPVSDAPASGGGQSGDSVQQAQQMLEENIAQSSGVQSWQTQLDETLKQILNRKDFSYDLNGDALYQQYKDQYVMQGRQAMMDTMGQAAAMTGGYGNSYAQGVGQQAYNSHIQQLGSRIPELYSLALSKYQSEGDALLDRYAILKAERDYADAHAEGSGGSDGGSDYGGSDTPATRYDHDDAAGEDAYVSRGNGGRGGNLSAEAQKFLQNLPPEPAEGDMDRWKEKVLQLLISSGLSNEDKAEIAYRLGL